MKKTILHIDDEADVRALLSQYLDVRGYRVISAASPTEAFKAIKVETPDLVITDLQLDESDGLATVEKLKELLPQTPVILLTGVLIEPSVAAATVGTKVAAYIEKTAPLTTLIAAIEQAIGH
jgi:two-component system response regulator GlrR